jgi:hypothetical protein
MSTSEGIISPSLVNRVRAILMKPKDEWRVIDGESTDISTMYRRYVIPLAAIGPLATFLGGQLFGTTIPVLGTVRVPIGNAILGALVTYGLSLAACYIVAMVIDNLAPRYGGTRNMTQAFKVSAYGSTAQWVAGVFALVPALSPLTILGLYSLYLFYLGLPTLMKVPQDKAMTYTITVVVVSIVIFILIGIVSAAVIGTAVGVGRTF